MKPAPFEYFRPDTLEEAISIAAQYGDDAKFLAGGQSLVPMMALRLATPAVLVDLNRLLELEYLRIEADHLAVGALTRHRALLESPEAKSCAMLVEAGQFIGHAAIRNRGTVGGSLAHADPAAEWGAIALALDGQCLVAGPDGMRTIPAEDLFLDLFTTALSPGEVLTEVTLKIPMTSRWGSAFLEVTRRNGDFALVGAGAAIVLDDDGAVTDTRIVLIGAHNRPVRSYRGEVVLRGERLTKEALTAAAEAVVADIDPVSDLNASAADRTHMAKVLVRRALITAGQRAGGHGNA